MISWISSAVLAGVDFSDFDTDSMRAVDDATKELESDLAAKEGHRAVANAEFIRDSLQWAAGYFETRGAADAVQWAREGRELAVVIAASAGNGDFNGAFESYNSLKRTCKNCHDAYKPPSL